MRASEVSSSFGTKETEVQDGEVPCAVSRPTGSASGSRGTFSCRRWRLLSGKPAKDDSALASNVSHQRTSAMVQRPTTAAVESNNWATAATPFAALLPRDTHVPTISRKAVAAAVLTSTFPAENAKKFDREMTICERKHVKAMGRMATRIYNGKAAGEQPSQPSRQQKSREKQTLKDQIYLPVLWQARARDSSPRSSPMSRPQETMQYSLTAVAIPDSLAGMKLLSSQLDELRAGLDSSRALEISRSTERLWYPQPQRSMKKALPRPTQTSNTAETDSNSSIETLLLRVLERPPGCSDGYQADHEDGTTTKSLGSGSSNNSEADLLLLLDSSYPTANNTLTDNTPSYSHN
ncbi:hypothetical protein V7S43_007801 [Phytophthora oleae]|uniref:Uncharacterized protein n=1 Tax=Phytophthora oleae TaxID=2107226 RepID=A0ABD3FM87_9STRA